jgi:phosphoenolpyruvate---glycerone phosphotransferase subunit DhaK
MVRRLLADPVAHKSERVSVLVNSLGATPLEELFIVYRCVAALLKKEGLTIVRPLVGHYVTSMEMAGLSISMIHLDAEREKFLAAPCACPFWRV